LTKLNFSKEQFLSASIRPHKQNICMRKKNFQKTKKIVAHRSVPCIIFRKWTSTLEYKYRFGLVR